MKRRAIYGCLFFLASVFSSTVSFAEETLKFATEAAYPPYNFMGQNGKIEGFDVDIGMAACKKMQRKCEFVQQDWDGIVAGLFTKKYDAIFSSMGITEERKKQILFTEPYHRPAGSFVGKADQSPKFDDLSLGGLSIGVIPGIYECHIKKAYPQAKLTVYPNADAIYLDLASGRIDLAFNGVVATNTSFLNTEEGKGFSLLGEKVKSNECLGEGAGVGLRPEQEELKLALDKAFKELRADGTYQEINAKYFPFDVYE